MRREEAAISPTNRKKHCVCGGGGGMEGQVALSIGGVYERGRYMSTVDARGTIVAGGWRVRGCDWR